MQITSKIKHNRLNLKIFMSHKNIIGVLFAGIFLYFGFFLYLNFLDMSTFDILSFTSKMNFYFSIILLVTSFLIFISSLVNNTNDVISSGDYGNDSYQKNMFFIFLIIVLLFNIIIFIGLIIDMILAGDLNNLYDYFIMFLYNVSIPQIICLGLSYILSRLKKYTFSIIIIIPVILLFSPFAENITWMEKPSFPIDQIYSIIKLPFEIFYQNSDWATDVQYGLQCETQRLFIFISWFIIIFLANTILNMKHSVIKKKSNKIYLTILSLLLLTSIYEVYQPQSKYRLNDNWDGNNYDWFLYGNSPKQKETKIDYKIDEYDLNISTNRVLNVDGKLNIKSNVPKNEYILTLYRNYKIENISSEKLLSYKQEDDYIYLKFKENISYFSLNIKYSGYHKKFYSNEQAAMLPGYFPWYPMAGKKQIFIHDNMSYGYKANKIEKAKFTLYTDKDYITNINKIGNHRYFSDEADSLSLFSGFINESHMDTVMTYLPFNTSNQDINQFVKEQENTLKESIDVINNQFGINLGELKNKKIIYVSKDISRNFYYNMVTFFDDYILTGNPLDKDILLQSYIQSSEKSTPLINIFSQISIGETVEETYQDLVDKISFSDENTEINSLKEKIIQIQNKLGSQKTLNLLIKYTFDYSINSDIKFLEGVLKND